MPISAPTQIPVDVVDGAAFAGAAERLRPNLFWRALALIAVIGVYVFYRELRVGAGRGVFERGLPVEPFRHALTIMKIEHATWLDFELGWQRFALDYGLIIRASNAYYAWAHQIVTLGLVIAVMLKAPWRKACQWVSGLLLQLPVALVCFAAYPLMPPRLMDTGAPWGGRVLEMHRRMRPTGFADTLVKIRGPWSPGAVSTSGFTNQFAAMPSLHCAFSLWVGVVWWHWAKGKSWRFVGFLHTAFTFWCVIVTGNHFVLDAVVGWAIALGALAVSARLWRTRRTDDPVPDEPQVSQGESNLMPSMIATSQ